MQRTASWNSVGKSVKECTDLDCVLQTAGLDYTVTKKPVYIPDEYGVNLIPLPNRFVTVREEDGHPYDVVSDKFGVVQNRDAFDFVSYMGDELRFVKAGETYNGVVYIIGVLPEVNILGDTFTPHVIFRNGFSGNVKITAAICPLRIVCQNQFNIAFKNTQNAITVRHMINAEAKLKEARDVLRMSADYMIHLNTVAHHYAGIKVSNFEARRVINHLFPIDPDANLKQFQIDRIIEQRNAFVEAYNADDNWNFKGTAWGMVNAYTDYITHAEPFRKTKTIDDSRFMSVTFNPMNAIMDSMNAIGIAA